MHAKLSLVSSLLTVLVLSGCGEPERRSPDGTAAATPAAKSASAGADDLVAAYLDDLGTMTALFKQVRDESSAKQHAPALQAAVQRMQGCADRLKSLDPTMRGMAFAAHAGKIMEIQQEMAPELRRISQDPTLARHLGDGMKPPKIN